MTMRCRSVSGSFSPPRSLIAFQPDWADDDVARRVRCAHGGECRNKIAIPFVGRQLVVRLVQQFENQFRRAVLIVLADLLPEGDETIPVLRRVVRHAVVMVHVEHDRQLRLSA